MRACVTVCVTVCVCVCAGGDAGSKVGGTMQVQRPGRVVGETTWRLLGKTTLDLELLAQSVGLGEEGWECNGDVRPANSCAMVLALGGPHL